MQIATLGVGMADRDTTTEGDIRGSVLHTLVVQSSLEFGAHKSISIAGILEDQEVNRKHGHVEGNGNDDEAESAGEEVLGKDAHGNSLSVTK